MKPSAAGIPPAHRVTSIEQLESIYGDPPSRSLVKEIEHISEHYRAFIEKAPFVTVATCGPEGLDCSPRGDLPGFVRVVDEKTLMIPDRRGNNRIDSMRNLVRDPRISLLFLIPGGVLIVIPISAMGATLVFLDTPWMTAGENAPPSE